MSDIGRFETRIDYIFNDQDLLRRALTHRSFQKQNNERLEFLGDSILGFIIAESLYHQFPRAPEGDLTKMRARLVRQSTLADLARKLGINDFLILGEGELKSGGGERDSILSDAIEAVFGAVYLDGGFRNAKTIVLKLFADKLIEINTEDLKDNKTRLQEILQKKEKPLPVYDVLNQTGDAHDLTFEVKCEIEHPNSPFLAQGRSRRTAEQNAAKLAIKALSES